jgi:hypothetical protein
MVGDAAISECALVKVATGALMVPGLRSSPLQSTKKPGGGERPAASALRRA